MRFHYGSPPEDPEFFPEAEGWSTIWDPGPWLLQLIALPVTFALLFISMVLIYPVFPHELFLLLSGPPAMAAPLVLIALGYVGLVSLILIPVHELLHIACHPAGGSRSVLGVWLSKGMFYAHYEGVRSRNRLLLSLVAPYIILALLPILLIPTLQALGSTSVTIVTVAFSCLMQTAFASGDAAGIGLVLALIPSTALVRNKGWKTYWKLRTSPD